VYCPEYPGLANEAVVIKAVLGYSKEAEAADFQSLNDTVQLQAVNPGLSLLQCGDCMKYSVDHSTGEIQRYPTGVPKTIPFGAKLPCQSFQGCLKGHWSAVRGLSNPRWAMTWRWYWSKQDIDGCPIQRRNRALMDWILLYGRNPGLNPFAVGAIDGGTAPVEPGRFVPIRKDGEGGK
jgi:hypothetical protein